MKSSKILLLTIICLMAFNTHAATITGIVSDNYNEVLGGVSVVVKGTTNGTITCVDGTYSIEANENDVLVFSIIGCITQEHTIKASEKTLNVKLIVDSSDLDEVLVVGYGIKQKSSITNIFRKRKSSETYSASSPIYYEQEMQNTEAYATTEQSGFKDVALNPLSTFSIDVDAASYSNLRRYINNGSLPPSDAVRVEEMINYFNYDYPQPKNDAPFSINTEYSACPWNNENYLLHVGLKGKQIEMKNLPASNIVFLIDVSGSMSAENKLPLLKTSLKLLVQQLRPEDRVAIVVYAGNSGLVLPSTSGKNKRAIVEALDELNSGGSTAGGAGLELAYKVAKDNFIDGGNNRIIMATDGDFNVGQSSNNQMEHLIEEKREKGIFISVLGYGMGNYKDDKMEIIADKGNGNYAYIDNIKEAKKVLVNEFGATVFTIAKDVKFQLEFNPAFVAEYRLIGYTNRLLNEEDFDDDKKDAGELGSGHTVTALYEIVPNGKRHNKNKLKYQSQELSDQANSNELVTLKLRYKAPGGNKSKLIEQVVEASPIDISLVSNNFKFSAAVAQFGMLIRNDDAIPDATWESTTKLAKQAKGIDSNGYRSEMIELIKTASLLSKSVASNY